MAQYIWFLLENERGSGAEMKIVLKRLYYEALRKKAFIARRLLTNFSYERKNWKLSKNWKTNVTQYYCTPTGRCNIYSKFRGTSLEEKFAKFGFWLVGEKGCVASFSSIPYWHRMILLISFRFNFNRNSRNLSPCFAPKMIVFSNAEKPRNRNFYLVPKH